MSLCYYILAQDQAYIGADTAITLNGERSIHESPKLMTLNGGSLLFMAGTVNGNVAVTQRLSTIPNVTVYDVQQALRSQYQVEQALNADYDSDSGKDLMTGVMFCMDGNSVIAYQMRSIDQFSIVEASAPLGGLYAAAAGYDAQKAHAKGLSLIKGEFDPINVMRHIFEHVSGKEVGGRLIVYRLSADGIQLLAQERIKENIQVPITNKSLFVPHAHMVAGTVEGSVIRGSEMNGNIIRGGAIYGTTISTRETGFPCITMSDTSNLLSAEYSASRSITIDPNNYLSNPYPHLRFAADSFSGTIHHAGSAGLVIDADTVSIKADLEIESGGKVWAASLSHYTFGSNQVNLQQYLEDDYVRLQEYASKIHQLEARIAALENEINYKADSGLYTENSPQYNAGIPIGTQLMTGSGATVTWGGIPAHSHRQV